MALGGLPRGAAPLFLSTIPDFQSHCICLMRCGIILLNHLDFRRKRTEVQSYARFFKTHGAELALRVIQRSGEISRRKTLSILYGGVGGSS